METRPTDISRVIQLAVAPVFLLTAIATPGLLLREVFLAVRSGTHNKP